MFQVEVIGHFSDVDTVGVNGDVKTGIVFTVEATAFIIRLGGGTYGNGQVEALQVAR